MVIVMLAASFHGEGFVYSAYSPPLWSYTLAALLRLPGSTRVSIQILQAVFCFGSAVVFGGLARRITGDRRAGLWTGLLVALQPSLLYYSVVKCDPLPLNVFLLGLIAASAIDLVTAPGYRGAVVFGILVGLGLLSRGTPIVALVVVLPALLLQRRPRALKSFPGSSATGWPWAHPSSLRPRARTSGGAITRVPAKPRLRRARDALPGWYPRIPPCLKRFVASWPREPKPSETRCSGQKPGAS